MDDLSKFLSPIDVNLVDLLLDPNNPRFADFDESTNPVPEDRIAEERVQNNTFERMKADRFEVSELRDTIRAVGYLPMDRIVVRKLKSNKHPGKYVVVEGNRRVTALKWLMELHQTGRESLGDDQIQSFINLPALLLDDERAPDFTYLVLPGLRHVSGVKEWGPYQRARAVFELRKAGNEAREVAQTLGLSTQVANRLWRSYLGLEQMRQDEEFGEFAHPDMYSYFEETIKNPSVRGWLNWDDAAGKFTNADNLREFYAWMVGDEDESDPGERGEKKLPEAKSIRVLGQFIDDSSALEVFRRKGATLHHALSRFEKAHPEAWQGSINNAKATLAALSTETLKEFSDEDLKIIQDLKNQIEQLLKDREKLIA